MSFPKLNEVEGKLKAVNDKIAGIFAEAGTEMDMAKVTSLDGDSTAKVEAIRALDEEANELGVERDGLKALQRAADASAVAQARGEEGGEPGGAETGDDHTKSLGELITASKAFTGKGGAKQGPESDIDFELKTLLSTTAGFAPETTRTGRIVDYATRPVQVVDFIPSVPTTQAAVVYMEETTFTNNAAEVAEAAQYGEAALAYTEKSSPVRKIGVWLPVTDEQLEDEPAMQARLNNRLPFMIRQRLDSQILVGDGVAPNIEGIGERTGIQTQAKSTDNVPDAVYKAMTKVRVTAFAMPNLVIMHPNDWAGVRLLRTTDGIYIWGNPADAGPERIWGTQVVQAVAQTENTGLVVDTSFLELSVRRGINVQITNAHDDFFIKGKQAIRADMRAALQVYRPAAICEVTGI